MDGEAEKQTQSSDIRLEQVENAVNFLSHPKVRGNNTKLYEMGIHRIRVTRSRAGPG
jgi:hypothetical protein